MCEVGDESLQGEMKRRCPAQLGTAHLCLSLSEGEIRGWFQPVPGAALQTEIGAGARLDALTWIGACHSSQSLLGSVRYPSLPPRPGHTTEPL